MGLAQGAIAYARGRLTAGGQPLRFVIAGVINTMFGLAIYPALLLSFDVLHRNFMLGLGIAQALSLCFAFAVYKFTVFRTRAGTVGEFGRFLPFYLFNYAVNWVALPLLVKVAHIDPIIAQCGFSLALMASSYFWHSRITFRGKPKP